MPTNASIEYWAEALRENHNSIAPMLHQMHDRVDSLPIEDLYLLRELLSRNAALISLLNEEVFAKPQPKSLWKKITRK